MESPMMELSDTKDEKRRDRAAWGHRAEFILSCIGYSVGMANIWRFPYVCTRNGGGAFLIPYMIVMLVCGIPMFVMELCLGQFSACGPLTVWKLCPLFKGIGFGMIIVCSVFMIYNMCVFGWILYFFGMSLRREVPWKTCDNPWNTDNCVVLGIDHISNVSLANETSNSTMHSTNKTSSSDEFWSNNVLAISTGLDQIGGIKWDLALCLLVAWLIVFVCVCKGIRSSGKVVYVTATLPYVLMIILLARGATLPGSLSGVIFYTVPQWEKLTDFQVWLDACLQVFFSLGPSWGALISLASHNDIHNDVIKEAVIICVTCLLSSLLAGFVIFTTLGFMAHTLNVPVDEVIAAGPGLVFVVYPEAVSKLPLSSFWAACMFLALANLCVDGMFGTMEAVISGLTDEYAVLAKKKTIFAFCLSIAFFLLGLPFVTKGGMYLFQVFDWYGTPFSLMVLGLTECLVVTYIYGIGKFYADVSFMLKRKLSLVWSLCWCFLTPGLLIVMFIVSAVQMVPPTYGSYTYPNWAIAMGWAVAMLSIIPIPAMALWKLYCQKGTLPQRVRALLVPSEQWGPLQGHGEKLEHCDSWKMRMAISCTSSDPLEQIGDVEESLQLNKC